MGRSEHAVQGQGSRCHWRAAHGFAAEGAHVAITGRDPVTLALRADVADLAATDSVMQAVHEHYGRIDALLINAGVGTFAPLLDVTEALRDQVLGINLKGHFFAAQKALPLMGHGSAIVFTGSIGSGLGQP
nr:SDR family oxidoreductase [uncultured Albidiferax sp.]